MRFISFLIVAAAVAAPVHAQATRPTTTAAAAATTAAAAAPRADRALIISIDGCRPDVLLRADTPNVRALMKEASFTLWARTTEMSVTLPSHVSMITGVPPEKHKITWNRDVPPDELSYPAFPTLFELAKKTGYTTALVSGKSKFVAMHRPGSLDWYDVPPEKSNYKDADVARKAVRMLRDHRPQLMMVHFPNVDVAGHAKGWGTADQLAAIESADAAVGSVLEELRRQDLFDKTLIILTADHGGSGRTHGKDDPRSRHIPWVCAGPGVRKNFDLTAYRDLVVDTEDTYATICAFLNIPPAPDTDGQPVLEVLEGHELMQPVKAATKPAATTTRPALLTRTSRRGARGGKSE